MGKKSKLRALRKNKAPDRPKNSSNVPEAVSILSNILNHQEDSVIILEEGIIEFTRTYMAYGEYGAFIKKQDGSVKFIKYSSLRTTQSGLRKLVLFAEKNDPLYLVLGFPSDCSDSRYTFTLFHAQAKEGENLQKVKGKYEEVSKFVFGE